jgi:hypothetical protein
MCIQPAPGALRLSRFHTQCHPELSRGGGSEASRNPVERPPYCPLRVRRSRMQMSLGARSAHAISMTII